eukprot:m.334519 g.334519  ORF g.334519 m.334519 type:complete len:154 (+) comp17371_c0_seq1:48-509(+)
MAVKAFCLVVITFLATSASASDGPDHGWHNDIEWHTFTDAKNVAKETGKPIMLIIHKTWCGACKALKPKFSSSEQVANLAKNFVMVNTEDDEEPTDSQFAPDGSYIPRILFMNTEGEVQKDLTAPGRDKYLYYFHDADTVVKGMENAIAHFSN